MKPTSSDHRLLIAFLAVLVLVAASSTTLVVAETRRHLLVPADSHADTHATTLTTGLGNATAPPAYQLCPDGSPPYSDGSCPQPVHHTRPS